jgi:S1-C subfamily serine protease
MSEHVNPAEGSDQPTQGTPAVAGEGISVPPTPDPGAAGASFALPPANSDLGAQLAPTGQQQAQLPATGPTPAVGSQTPPAGVPVPTAPPAGYGWGVGAPTGNQYPGGYPGAGGAGTVPPQGGWPPAAGFSAPAPRPPMSKKKRTGLLAATGIVAVAAAVAAGAGLGHAVWPQTTTASAVAPSTPSSGGTGSGGTTSPFGGSGGTSGGSSGGSSPFGSGSSGSSGTGSAAGSGAPANISGIASQVDPGLVDINTNLSYQNEQAAGTGMVLTSTGEILTNNHVIDGATSISVTDVGNGKTYTANVVGYDRTGDVAVIQLVNASGLQTITPASGSATVGEPVVGIGNAGGTGGTPSTAGGSITALNQSITASDSGGGNAENLTGLIEVNAGIQAGDSGGALVNASGQVVGMDTAASTSNGVTSAASQGYAIPINTALNLAKQIKAGDATSAIHIGGTGFLGVSVQESTSTGTGGSSGGGFGSGFGGGTGSTSTSGAVVVSTLPGSPSATAGLVAGDVITGLNGKTITQANDLTNDLGAFHPGDTVQLTWTNASGQSQTASVTLTTGPPA